MSIKENVEKSKNNTKIFIVNGVKNIKLYTKKLKKSEIEDMYNQTNQQNKCQCDTTSCKVDCERLHTHKVYSCHECEPSQQNREEWDRFISNNCECHVQEPYGFVPEADCKEHDTDRFHSFLEYTRQSAAKEGYAQEFNDASKTAKETISALTLSISAPCCEQSAKKAREEVLREVIEMCNTMFVKEDVIPIGNIARLHNGIIEEFIIKLKQLK